MRVIIQEVPMLKVDLAKEKNKKRVSNLFHSFDIHQFICNIDMF